MQVFPAVEQLDMAFEPVQINCATCGASLFFDPAIKLSKCNYCGSYVLLDQVPVEGDWPEVDWIFEDRVDQRAFEDKLAVFLTEHPDTPDNLLDVHKKLMLHLCYLPFYRFQVEYHGNWSADAGYERTEQERYYNESTKRWDTRSHTVTDWHPASGSVVGARDFRAPAAKETKGLAGLFAPLAEDLDPQDRHAFDPQLLAGSSWLSFDIDEDQVFRDVVFKRVDVVVNAEAYAMVPGDTKRNFVYNWQCSRMTERELIPFWVYHYIYGGESYAVAIDAVAGRLTGGRPTTSGRRWAAAALALLPLGLYAFLAYDFLKHGHRVDVNDFLIGGIIAIGLAVLGPVHFRSGISSRKAKLPRLGPEARMGALRRLSIFQRAVFGAYAGLSLVLFAVATRVGQTFTVSTSGTVSMPPEIRTLQAAGAATVEETRKKAKAVSTPPTGMVLAPAGNFMMGDATEKKALSIHQVTIPKPFFIDKLEVTVSEYEQCLAGGKCTPTSIHGPDITDADVEKFSPMCNAQHSERGDHPVNCVDRQQAVTYCTFVDKRLPTEEEWEYAARGTDGRIYPWGNDAPKCDRAVVSGCARVLPSAASTRPVGSFPNSASPFGALDMAGNVWEWVSDDWDAQGANLVGSAREPGVLRGGSWDFAPTHIKSFVRIKFYVSNGHVSTGFRCAKDAGP